MDPEMKRYYKHKMQPCTFFRIYVCVRKMPLCTHLPDLLTHNGEHPEVQNILGDSWTQGWRTLEVHQQHVGKQQEEKEVHQDVAQKRSDGSKPELTPSGHYERTLRRSLRLWYTCN